MSVAFLTNPLRPLNTAVLTRGDDIDLSISHVEPGQTGATLKFTAMLLSEFPNGTPKISKAGADFTSVVSGNSLTATFSIASAETVFVLEKTEFIYDIERTVSGKKKTLERGRFVIDPDVTP